MKSVEINPSETSIDWMHKDENGFNAFLLSRSSDKMIYCKEGTEVDKESEQAESISLFY